MYYCGEWDKNVSIGTPTSAFIADFIDSKVRLMPARYIAIVRHSVGKGNAVKVWKLKDPTKNLLELFQTSENTATTDEVYSHKTTSFANDPIFSVNGNLIFNWRISDNGIRLTTSETQSLKFHNEIGDIDYDNCGGIGVQVGDVPRCGSLYTATYGYEVGLINPNLGFPGVLKVLGSNHGTGSNYVEFESVDCDFNYAVFISSTFSYKHFPLDKPLTTTIYNQGLYDY